MNLVLFDVRFSYKRDFWPWSFGSTIKFARSWFLVGRRHCEARQSHDEYMGAKSSVCQLCEDLTIPMSGSLIPIARQLAVLLAMLLLTVSCTFWLRFGVLEDRAVALSCRQGSGDWLCLVRIAATFSYEHSLLGSLAVLLAAMNLVRPSFAGFAVATVVAAISAVLYNVGGAGIAITLVILSLARDQRETV